MTTEMTALLDKGLAPSPEKDMIVGLLEADGNNDETARKHDLAFHRLMDGAHDLNSVSFVAKVLSLNPDDLRAGVAERFMKECKYQEVSTPFNAIFLINKFRDNPENVGKYDFGCHSLITWANTDEEWDTVTKELLRSVADLHAGVRKHFIDECPEEILAKFNAELAVQLTKMLEKVKRWDESDVMRMHWIIDILGETEDETKELFGKFRDIWGVLHASVAMRLGISRGNGGNSDGMVGFASSPPQFLTNPLTHTVEELEAKGWEIQRDDGRQVILAKDGESKTAYRPKTRSASAKRPKVKKEKKGKKASGKKNKGDK